MATRLFLAEGRITIISIVIITISFLLIIGCSAVVWRFDDPRLVIGVTPKEYESIGSNPKEDMVKRYAALRAHVGEIFPDLTLINKDGNVMRLSSFRGKRLAILSAIADCSFSVEWMKALSEKNWRPPDGFDELVVLVNVGGIHKWNRLIRECPKAFLVGYPLEGFLSVVRWYPVMLSVSSSGVFEGFWAIRENPVPPLVNSGAT